MPHEQETRQEDRLIPNVTCPEAIADRNRAWLVRATENISVPRRCRQRVVAKLEAEKNQDLPQLVSNLRKSQSKGYLQREDSHTAA